MKKIIAIKNGFKKKICVALTVLTFVGGLPLVGYSQNLFRWAAQNDILTLDPHSQNHATTNNILNHAYEGLVQYDKNLKVEPALATSWTVISPTVWRFNLRPNVKFHDGAALTADDVLFSFDRIRQPSSTHVIYVAGIKEIKKINDLTIDLVLDGPNPTLLNTLVGFMIMNKSWSEKNNSSKVQDYKAKEETFASRNENGTGPFIIKEWVPSQKVVMTKNKNWWGTPAGNVTDVVYTPISSDPTRVAALIAGDVDAVTDLPTQDVGRLKSNSNIKVLDGSEVRTIFIQMDLGSDSLKYGSPGKNPFKDVRVRQAMSKTVDRVAIQRTIMRGLSVPGVLMVAPGVNGFNEEANKPFTVDIEGAKKLLQEAGYPNGFEFTLDCPNNRYVNDEEICQALVNMWAKIGIQVKLNSLPFATFAAKFQAYDSSAFLLGWGVATLDAQYTLLSILRTRAGGVDGNFNFAKVSNAKLDALIDSAKTEMDKSKRDAILAQALAITRDEALTIPIHHQVRPWAFRNHVTMVHSALDTPKMVYVTSNK